MPEIMGRSSTNSTHLWRCMLQRRKHPWINLEWRIWNLLPDAVWTDDPEQATLFVVPHAMLGHACQGNAALTKRYLVDGMAKFLHHIVHAMPYYNRSGGRDHVTVLLDENGPLCNCETRQILAPNNTFTFNVLMSMMKIGHWAHHNQSMFGWQNHFDIAMPQFGAVPESFGPVPYLPPRRWEQVVESPKYSFGFSGSYWGREVPCPATIRDAPPESLGSKHVCACSPGTRTWLQKYMKKQCNSSATARPTTRCEGESGRMGTFWYALCPAAWACWSSRLYHAIDRLTVPVIMADGAIQPFEDVLDWSSFAVQLETTRLRSNNVSQLDWLHYDALNADAACSTCTTCHGCTRQPLVKRVRMLERVRPWFLYNGTAPYNAIGLLLIELHCRQASRGRAGPSGTARGSRRRRAGGRRTRVATITTMEEPRRWQRRWWWRDAPPPWQSRHLQRRRRRCWQRRWLTERATTLGELRAGQAGPSARRMRHKLRLKVRSGRLGVWAKAWVGARSVSVRTSSDRLVQHLCTVGSELHSRNLKCSLRRPQSEARPRRSAF